MLELLADPHAWAAFATLTALELVLGIDNIIFISILVDRLPPEQREWTRKAGLLAAMLMRLGLLFMLSWIIGMTMPLFTLPVTNEEITVRDLVLLLGGLFLLWKSVGEIHETLEGPQALAHRSFKMSTAITIIQIMVVDLVFSLDSIITAIGMVDQVEVMVAAVVASVGLMMVFAAPISRFVSAHPTVRMLALAFLVVIGVVLIAEGFGHHVPKGYMYSAMAFSLAVEMLNIRLRKPASTTSQVQAASYTSEAERNG
jgi:predicted tellurium resistance membrane protein TerC